MAVYIDQNFSFKHGERLIFPDIGALERLIDSDEESAVIGRGSSFMTVFFYGPVFPVPSGANIRFDFNIIAGLDNLGMPKLVDDTVADPGREKRIKDIARLYGNIGSLQYNRDDLFTKVLDGAVDLFSSLVWSKIAGERDLRKIAEVREKVLELPENRNFVGKQYWLEVARNPVIKENEKLLEIVREQNGDTLYVLQDKDYSLDAQGME
tara:strand:- start:2234 stop:2860 length:627 start_codon:yes stop_codon:yes gene_type:complete